MNGIEDFYGWLDFFNSPNLSHLTEEQKRTLYRKMLFEKQQLAYQKFLMNSGVDPGGGGSVVEQEAPPENTLRLWLDATVGKTGSPVSLWNDQTINSNNAVQATEANRPIDNTTRLTFDGTRFMTVNDSTTLDIKEVLSLEATFSTSSSVNFMGLMDKYIGSTSGYALFLNGSKQPTVTAGFLKVNPTVAGSTVVNDGNQHKVLATIECTRKFYDKSFVCDGEEPEIIKVGSVYYMFFDKYDGSKNNIYLRASLTKDFSQSPDVLVLEDYIYCCITQDGSTFRLVVTTPNIQNFVLFTSSSIAGTYTQQGTLLTYGDVVDSLSIADPHEQIINGTYFLYYSAFTGVGVATIAYATSPSGLPGSYTKQGTCLDKGTGSDFDLTLVADPDVSQLNNGTYIMFYTGYNSNYTKQQQGYATSSDGISWIKNSGNPIHFFSGETFENGIYGPNEPSAFLENGVWYIWYRSDNTTQADCKISLFKFDADQNGLPICGNETITTKIYVDDVLETTDVQTGALGLDYIVTNSEPVYIGGDNGSTNYFVGDIYDIKISSNILS